MSKQKVTIGGKDYLLDIEKAMQDGYLSETSPLETHHFSGGDVFKDPTNNINSFLLVETSHHNEEYQILGLGCCVNSGEFYRTTHKIQEIREYLISKRMVFEKNINYEINLLVNG